MGYKVDSQPAELFQGVDQLPHATRKPVEPPNDHNVKLAAPGIGHHSIQSRSEFLGPADTVTIYGASAPTPLGDQLPQWPLLHCWVLVERHRVPLARLAGCA